MPSLINELALTEIKTLVGGHPSLMLVDPSRLKADESLTLRRKLFDVGATMRLAKARLVKRAVGPGLGGLLDGSGSLAIVCGEDIAAAAKIIRELAEKEKLAVRGGLAEGTPLDARSALKLADLPSKHQARAMVVKAIRAPLVRLAKTLRAPVRKLGRVAVVRKDKLGG